MGQCQPRALFPIDEVVDDVLDTDEGARDEAKEANKEESSIFGSSDSKTNYLRPSFLFQRKIHFIAFNTINFYCHKMVAMSKVLTWYICDLVSLCLSLLEPSAPR